jgi:hypothetical protein
VSDDLLTEFARKYPYFGAFLERRSTDRPNTQDNFELIPHLRKLGDWC